VHGDLDQTLAVLYQPKVTAEISVSRGIHSDAPGARRQFALRRSVSIDAVTGETPCILYGGRSSTDASATVFNDVWQLTRDDCNRAWIWVQLNPQPDPVNGAPAPRYGHAAVVLQTPADGVDVMLVFGGKNAAGQVLNDLWELRLYQGEHPYWRKITPFGSTIPSLGSAIPLHMMVARRIVRVRRPGCRWRTFQ